MIHHSKEKRIKESENNVVGKRTAKALVHCGASLNKSHLNTKNNHFSNTKNDEESEELLSSNSNDSIPTGIKSSNSDSNVTTDLSDGNTQFC